MLLGSLAPARRRFLLALLGLAAAVIIAVGGVAGMRLFSGTEPVPQDRPGPVVLVAGYGGDTDSLDALVEVLAAAGRDTVVQPAAGGGTGDLDDQADRLADTVDQVLEDSGAPSVDVVGYSAGGLVARLWVRDHGGDEVARRVLTLGSPHHGTGVAELAAGAGCPTACEQLAPDSALLAHLNAGDETPQGPQFISVWTTSDQTVTPPDSADLEGALDFTVQSVCPDATTSHGALPSDPVVLAAVGSVLGPGRPQPPADVACPGR